MPKLTYSVGGATKTVEVTDSCSIGRLPENTIPLENENGASRRHCQILKVSSGFELSDLGSTNGTKVNGQKVKRHKLKDGDEIAIGDTVLRWSDGAGKAAEEEVLLEGDVSLEEPAAAPKSGGGAGSSEQCYLVFAGGPKDGERVALEKKRITFGRNAKNTFVFAEDKGVSGYHCEIAREGGAYVLRDLGSTNGTLVDGEPVSETALQHGNRIRIGGQRLVFVDPAISDFEKAMAGVDDLGSEWGLLRAEMDMSRVQQARRSQMVGIAAALVVLAGIGYVAVFMPQVWSGGKTIIQPIQGNLFSDDFSFEDGTGAWTTPAGSPAVGKVAVVGDGAQGKAYFTVGRDGPLGRGAAVQSGRPVRVTPDAAYEFGAMVRTRDRAEACVRVVWTSAEGAVVGESATDVVSGDGWTQVRGSVGRPPRDGAAANVQLVNMAGGTAAFDDVYFGPAGSKPATIDMKGGELAVEATPDGQFALRRGSVTLFSEAGVVGGAAKFDTLETARRTDRVGARKSVTVAGGKVSGQALDAALGTWSAFSCQVALAEDRYADLTLEMGEGAAFVGRISKQIFDDGCSVTPTEGRATRVSDARALDGVRSVRFGERNVFEISAPADAPAFRIVLARSGDRSEGWLVAIAGTRLQLRVDTDAAAIRSRVEKLRRDLDDSLRRKQWGDVVRLQRELAASLPQGTPDATTAASEADRIEQGGTAEIEAIRRGREAAEYFRDAADLQNLVIRSRDLAQHWTGHPVAKDAQDEEARIQTILAKRLAGIRERAAIPFLARADDYRESKDLRLAAAIYRGIVGAYPGTEAAKQAQKALEALPQGN